MLRLSKPRCDYLLLQSTFFSSLINFFSSPINFFSSPINFVSSSINFFFFSKTVPIHILNIKWDILWMLFSSLRMSNLEAFNWSACTSFLCVHKETVGLFLFMPKASLMVPDFTISVYGSSCTYLLSVSVSLSFFLFSIFFLASHPALGRPTKLKEKAKECEWD